MLPAFIGPIISRKALSLFRYSFVYKVGQIQHHPSLNLQTFKCLAREQVHLMKCSYLISITNLHVSVLCLLPLCRPIIPQVQSEMLKKWKRWKLGKDIDEEYRHTHSHTPHVKSGSIATSNLPYLHDNNGSEPSGDSPPLNKADGDPSCSAAPEENRRLVVSYSNGTGKGGPAKSRHALQFSFLPRRGAGSHVSTATEDVCLEERMQGRTYPLEGEETNVWGRDGKLSLIVLIDVSDQRLSHGKKSGRGRRK